MLVTGGGCCRGVVDGVVQGGPPSAPPPPPIGNVTEARFDEADSHARFDMAGPHAVLKIEIGVLSARTCAEKQQLRCRLLSNPDPSPNTNPNPNPINPNQVPPRLRVRRNELDRADGAGADRTGLRHVDDQHSECGPRLPRNALRDSHCLSNTTLGLE